MESLVRMKKVNKDFWQGKRVFLTGHTGFKGGWMSVYLSHLGATVCGYSLEPETTPNLFDALGLIKKIESHVGDIRDLLLFKQTMVNFNPDIVIHMAAQPLVRKSYVDPVETYSTNVMGTVNLFEACRACKNLRAVINITTDKCYENKEWVWGYREDDRLGGYDPYSNSKACAELVSSSYRSSFLSKSEVLLATVRAGNVIGGGDWAEDRLVPDVLRAFGKGSELVLRSPNATRPWQFVMEPLVGYLLLAEKLYQGEKEFEGGWNFGPTPSDVKSVGWIVEKMANFWGDSASWSVDKSEQPHEAGMLSLDISKSRLKLGWHPQVNLEGALSLIVDWDNSFKDGESAWALCTKQIQGNYV